MARLGDIASVITKGTTPTSIGFDFADNGINFIKVESISESGEFIPERFAHIDDVCHEKLKRSQLAKNDILFSIAGAIGRTAIVNEDILPANTNQALAIIRIPNGIVNYSFLSYVLESPSILKQFEKKKQGVAQLNISLKDVSDFIIPDVSLEEQCQIASVFDKISILITLRKQQLNKLDELVKARFVEMFGNPVENPLGWDQRALEEVTLKIGSGATPKGGKETYQTDGITLVRSMNVYDGHFEYKDLAHITDEQAKQLDIVEVFPNDVFINITGASVARSCVVPDNILPARVNQHVSIIRCDSNRLNYIFLNQLFLSSSYKKLLLTLGESGGATRQAITKQQLEKLPIVVPPLTMQNAFSQFVLRVEKCRLTVRQGLDKLEMMKKALMQEYFG